MSSQDCRQGMRAEDLAELRKAVELLENQGFVRPLNNVAGKPTDKTLEYVPRRAPPPTDRSAAGAFPSASSR
jgi:hypothetical protein